MFGWTVLPHSPYFPDLAPSDLHLLGPLKDALRGTRFGDDDSVIRAVRTWLREQETSSYREGMHTLVSRWRKAVRRRWRFCRKITCVKETSCYTVREFHTFRINCFR